MPRPKGTCNWTPEKWGSFWNDVYNPRPVTIGKPKKVNRSEIARRLAKTRKYGGEDNIRQILQEHARVSPGKMHATSMKYRSRVEQDEINNAIWRQLLGEDEK
jgi:hypothetical protein